MHIALTLEPVWQRAELLHLLVGEVEAIEVKVGDDSGFGDRLGDHGGTV